MEIRKVSKEMVYDIYIAEDGSEHITDSECLMYERNLKEKRAKAVVNNIKQISSLYPNADASYEYYWYYIENEEQRKALQDYYNSKYIYDNCFLIELPQVFQTWFCIRNDGEDTAFMGTIEDYRKEVEEFFKTFEE